MMHVPEKFSLPVLGDSVDGFLPPERPIHMEVRVVRVHANIFSEVSNSLFGVAASSGEVHTDDSGFLSHLSSISFIDDLSCDEKMGIGFVCRGQTNSTGFGSV
jgi:hypothetical protein